MWIIMNWKIQNKTYVLEFGKDKKEVRKNMRYIYYLQITHI